MITTTRWRQVYVIPLVERSRSEALLGVSEVSPVGFVLEAGHLDDVEVDVSHEMRGGGVGRLEAVEEHVVAGAVRLAIDRVVGEVVPRGEGAHFRGAEVVRAATPVQPPVSAEVVVVRRYVARAAPFRTWNQYLKY